MARRPRGGDASLLRRPQTSDGRDSLLGAVTRQCWKPRVLVTASDIFAVVHAFHRAQHGTRAAMYPSRRYPGGTLHWVCAKHASGTRSSERSETSNRLGNSSMGQVLLNWFDASMLTASHNSQVFWTISHLALQLTAVSLRLRLRRLSMQVSYGIDHRGCAYSGTTGMLHSFSV